MDLGSLDLTPLADIGFELQLRDPATDQPLPIFITVRGHDSTVYMQASRELQRRRLARAAKGAKAGDLTPEAIEEEALSLLVAATASWRDTEVAYAAAGGANQIEIDGKHLECTRENVRAVYARFRWIRDQVDAAIHDRANFLGRSPTA